MNEILQNKEISIQFVIQRYEDEIDRKTKLESKAIGYFTILGISIATMVGVVPFWCQNILQKSNHCDLISFMNFFIFACFVVYITITVVALLILSNAYSISPSERVHIEDFWASGINESSREDYFEHVFSNYNTYIKNNFDRNEKIAEQLKTVNLQVTVVMLISLLVLVATVTSYVIVQKGV